jgi:hypothetical protein
MLSPIRESPTESENNEPALAWTSPKRAGYDAQEQELSSALLTKCCKEAYEVLR